MKNLELNDEKKIPYQFTATPLNLMYIMDSDCLKLLNLLIQEESYWRSQGRLDNGYFFKSINDLKEDMFMSNDKDVRLTIEALFINGLIDVIPQGNVHKASKFKLNMEKIMDYDSMTITDVKKFAQRICKLPRKSTCTYMNRNDLATKQSGKVDTKCSTDCPPDCTPKLYKSDSLNNLDLLYKSDCLNNIENVIINNNIIDNKNFKQDHTNSLINQIEDKEITIVDTKYQQISDASIPKVDAQRLVPLKRETTNEDLILKKFMKDFSRYESKEINNDELCSLVKKYPINEIQYLTDKLSNTRYESHGVYGWMKYLIGIHRKNLKLQFND